MKSSDILKEIKRIAKEVLPKGGQLRFRLGFADTSGQAEDRA